MTRSATSTPDLEHAADRAPRHSVERLVRRFLANPDHPSEVKLHVTKRRHVLELPDQ